MSVSEEFRRLKGICYLDHAGATLYSEEQIRRVMSEFNENVFGNPHSASITSKTTLDSIDQIRYEVLRFFNTVPEDYSVVFTSGATAALKLVAECFDFSRGGDATRSGVFAYSRECHTSVLGMREMVASRCSSVIPLPQEKLKRLLGGPEIEMKQKNNSSTRLEKPESQAEPSNSLFVYSGQCNFSGLKNPLSWIRRCHQGACNQLSRHDSHWYCLLDAASLISTSALDLSVHKPDFVVLSFYKIMGYPTGLGALLVRNSSAHSLSNKTYFGGGSVLMALSGQREHTLRNVLHERLEDGTIPFLSILALRSGFETIKRLKGDMSRVQKHTFALARQTYRELKQLRHGNGVPVVEFYCDTDFEDPLTQGAIINMNLLRPSGEYVGYSEVLHMANSHEINLRVGCFCNLGACQRHLGLSDDDIRTHFQAGHVCGDGMDIINGQPTGSVRISFGYMSTESDVETFLNMIRSCFVRIDCGLKPISPVKEQRKSICGSEIQLEQIRLTQVVLFPVKSCGGFRPEFRWPIGPTGLHFDRKWMVVNSNGVVFTQKHEPRLALIRPRIDEAQNLLWLSFPGCPDCAVPLDDTARGKESLSSLCLNKVCEDRVRGWDCGQGVSDWLRAALGQPGFRLVRQMDKDSRSPISEQQKPRAVIGLANSAQFLLVNEATVEWLGDQLPSDHNFTKQGLLDRFRANLIVRGSEPFEEMSWDKLRIGGEKFEVTGPCARCSVVCVDQETGKRTKEPLRTLAEVLHGNVQFGVYLNHLPQIGKLATISVNDTVSSCP